MKKIDSTCCRNLENCDFVPKKPRNEESHKLVKIQVRQTHEYMLELLKKKTSKKCKSVKGINKRKQKVLHN